MKNDFHIDRITGSHYILYNPKTLKRVVLPYHKKDIPKGTLFSILKASGLSLENFK